jgi:hypothetical protein
MGKIMSKAAAFKKWFSERMGHSIELQTAHGAILELEGQLHQVCIQDKQVIGVFEGVAVPIVQDGHDVISVDADGALLSVDNEMAGVVKLESGKRYKVTVQELA